MTPPAIRVCNVTLHEPGHFNGSRDPHSPGGTQDYCHGRTTSASVLYCYVCGIIEAVTTSGEAAANREY